MIERGIKLSKPRDISCKRSDCFAYRVSKNPEERNGGYCNALNDTNFKGRPCPFFKPAIEYEEQEKEKK